MFARNRADLRPPDVRTTAMFADPRGGEEMPCRLLARGQNPHLLLLLCTPLLLLLVLGGRCLLLLLLLEVPCC